MTITTDGGTVFTVANGQVTINHGGHAITVPLADLQEFLELYIDHGDDE